ncbi:MAG: FtsX-like permease family protein [Gammaproteobacteria bacterium]|nr:FtsX-like permease family protein [Gammaproteobacteria bacterium]MDE0270761.1 FtsX-like permease family protein [Gammaproteobacteria bacterium]
MRLALWIAARHLWRGRNRYARLINWMTLAGLGVGVLVLTVVVSVMNGFDAELRSRILGTVPHALLPVSLGVDAQAAARLPGVAAAYPFFQASGMVVGAGGVAPVAVYGIDAADAGRLAAIDARMQTGRCFGLTNGRSPGAEVESCENVIPRSGKLGGRLEEVLAAPTGLAMGRPLARRLGLVEGDPLRLALPQADGGRVQPRFKAFRLQGLFEVGAEFDYALVVVSRAAFDDGEMQRLGADGIRVVLDDPLAAGEFATMVAATEYDAEAEARVETWIQNYGELFLAVRIEKALMFLILLLIVAVAGFNIVSSQTMVIDSKRADIAVLRSLGATGTLVQRVFLAQGVLVATLGIVSGLMLGVAAANHIGPIFAVLESWLGLRLLEGSYFESVPSQVLPSDLALIGGLSWLLCLLSAWIPARRAARQNPVEGLHA